MARRATRKEKSRAIDGGGSWVYFIEMPAFAMIKIGWTQLPIAKRLVALQTGCPAAIGVVAVMPGGPGTEACLHEFFATYRVHGEWFRDVPEIRDYAAREAIAWSDILPPTGPRGSRKAARRAVRTMELIEEESHADYEGLCVEILGYVPRLPRQIQADLLFVLRTSKAMRLVSGGLDAAEIAEEMGFPCHSTASIYAAGTFRNGRYFSDHEP